MVIETYSVLTRLPAGLAVRAAAAAQVLRERFDDPSLRLADEGRDSLLAFRAIAG